MILTPFNSTNRSLWGKDLKFLLDGEIIDDSIKIPDEIDFIATFFPKDPIGARRYYAER